MKNKRLEDKVFKQSLGTIMIGVNDGEFNLAIFDERARSSVKTGEHPVDIGRIERKINLRYGNEISYVIDKVTSDEFLNKDNKQRRGVIIQSFSNEYVKEYPERFGGVKCADLDYAEWRSLMIELAEDLCKFLHQKKAVIYFEDLPKGDVAMVVVNPE